MKIEVKKGDAAACQLSDSLQDSCWNGLPTAEHSIIKWIIESTPQKRWNGLHGLHGF